MILEDGGQLDPLASAVYQRLRTRAAALLRRRGDHGDPETVSLVNGVFLGILRSLEKGSLPEFTDDGELLKYLSRSMRNYLVNRALARRAARRPPDDRRVDLPQSVSFPASSRSPDNIIDVNEALERLARRDERAALVVELIFFGGYTHAEVAEILGEPPRTIRRDWEFARAWLAARLKTQELE